MTEQPKLPQHEIDSIRFKIKSDLEKHGNAAVYEKLLLADPNAKKTINVNDTYRIIRALEAMQITGQPWSKLNDAALAKPLRYPAKVYCLSLSKEELLVNIKNRTQAMLSAGLIEEVKKLVSNGYDLSHKPMQSIGYLQTYEWLQTTKKENDLFESIVLATKQLVKRQLTWFRAEKLFPIQQLSEVDAKLIESEFSK
jgi:tRNA dimethylallyltransferase